MSSPPSSLPVRQQKKHIQYPGHISRQQHALTHIQHLIKFDIAHQSETGGWCWSGVTGSRHRPRQYHVRVYVLGGWWWVQWGGGASQQEQHNRAATQQTSVLRSHMRISRMGALVCLDRYSPDVYLYIVAARAAGSHQNDRVWVVCTQWCSENFLLGGYV